MDKKLVSEVLQRLAQGNKGRSETAQLGDILEEVERALAAGVTRAALLEVLHEQGFTFTFHGFLNALYRLRKRRKAQAQTPAPPAAAAPSPAPEPNRSPPPVTLPPIPTAPPYASAAAKPDDDRFLTPRQQAEREAAQYSKPRMSPFMRKFLEEEDKKQDPGGPR